MKNKYHCNPVNKYLDISKLDLEKWKRAGALLGLGLDGNLTLLEKPNYTDEGNGKEALFDDGKYRKVYTIDEVDKLLKDLNISGDTSIKEVADALSKFQSSQEAINTELNNKDVAQDKRMDELVKDISTNTANIEGTDSKVETNKVDIQYIKDNYLNKDNVNTLASKEEVKAVKDITEVNRGLIDNNRKDINSLLEGEDSYTHFRGFFDTEDTLKIVTFPKVNDFAYVEETHTKWQFTVDHKWVDTKHTYPRDTRNASKAEFDESIKESNEALEKAVNELNNTKVDKTVYEEDLASLEEYKESQSELNAKQDIDINKNLQNINQLNDMIKVLSQKDEPIMSANGGGVINLPNNAMKSVVPKYKIEGLTVQNLVKNGDFRYGKEGWSAILKNRDELSIVEGGLNISFKEGYGGNTINLGSFFKINNTISKGDRFYIYLNIYNYNLDNKGRMLQVRLNLITYHTLKTKKGVSSSIHNAHEDLNEAYITINGGNSSITDNYTINTIKIINLTQAFGKGNEPSKEWCDEHIQGYFEGTKSVQTPMRVKGVGENLLYNGNGEFGLDGWVALNNATEIKNLEGGGFSYKRTSSGARGGVKTLIYLPKGEYWIRARSKGQSSYVSQDYTLAPFKGEGWRVILQTSHTGVGVEKFSIDKSDYYWLRNENMGAVNSIQKFGEVSITRNKPSAYIDSLKPSLYYINNQLELKSVGTTNDYIEDDKLYKNTKRYYFTKEDKWILRKGYEGSNFSYYMNLPFKYKTTGAGVKGELFCNNFIPISNVPDVLIERESGTIALFRENSSVVYLTLDKKIDDVNSVIPEGTFIDVILPETEVTNLDTSGNVVAHPNGTIFIEPITNVTAYYNDGLDVSNFNIESVEEFAVFKDGNYQSLDISKIKITDNKLTHPDAINGLCYLVFRYDNNPIFGDNEVEYYNNDGILVSPDGTFWKPVLTVDDEGNILMKGEKL